MYVVYVVRINPWLRYLGREFTTEHTLHTHCSILSSCPLRRYVEGSRRRASALLSSGMPRTAVPLLRKPHYESSAMEPPTIIGTNRHRSRQRTCERHQHLGPAPGCEPDLKASQCHQDRR